MLAGDDDDEEKAEVGEPFVHEDDEEDGHAAAAEDDNEDDNDDDDGDDRDGLVPITYVQAWRKLSLKYHPDKTQLPDCIFVEIRRPLDLEEAEGCSKHGSSFSPCTCVCAGCNAFSRLESKSFVQV